MGLEKISVIVGLFIGQFLALASPAAAFTQIILFGDSLSDDGNVAHRVRDTVGFSYPSTNFNYSNYRFTNDFNTNPASRLYHGTWHEQLAQSFLHLPVATNSLDGGTDFAFGGATTEDGTQQRTLIGNPTPFGGGSLTVTIDNMGKQVDDYIASHATDANALYILWGGGNDLFDDDSAANVTATAARVGNLVQRLANAGARNFLVPNVPPLGAVPNSFGDLNTVAARDLASASYRNQLNSVIATTKATLVSRGITVQIFALDSWLNGIRVLGQPAKYGLVNVITPAQGESVNPDQYLYWDDIHPTTSGHHQIAREAWRLVTGQIPPLGRATNVSARALVSNGENALISGFIITGTAPKTVIVRALGQSLSAFGVNGVLPDPTLTIFNSSNRVVAANNNWQDTQRTQITASGYAPGNYFDSAILVTLTPGSYTAVVQGKNGGAGVALVDVYDLSAATNSTFRNLSTRSFVGTGDDVLIGGLIIASGEPPVVVVRAIGPELSNYGIAHPLQDPTLELRDVNGALVAFNDNWQDTNATAIKATLLPPVATLDSAIVASLPAGNYTAIVRGKNGATGVALVEAYRLQ